MEPPASLPGRLFLLAWNPERRRVGGHGVYLGLVLRASALTDLYLSGHLADEHGKVRAEGRDRIDDPLLAEVRDLIASSKPRSWRHWVEKDKRAVEGAVREQLRSGGWIRVDTEKVLGLFTRYRVTARDPIAVGRMRTQTARLMCGSGALGDVDRRAAATAALAAVGGLGTVAGRRERRRARERIGRLTDQAGPALPALRRAIIAEQAAAASSSGG